MRHNLSPALAIAAIVFGATVPLTLGAQSQLREVDAARLRLGSDSLAIYLVRDGDTTRTGTLFDELRMDQGARPLLRRVYRTVDQVLGVRVDSIADEWPTLDPAIHRSRSNQSFEFYRFAGGRVQGWMRLANGDSVDVDVTLPTGTFNASSVDLAIRAAPLAGDWSADVRAFLPNSRTVVALRARVDGSESVAGEDTWRVIVDFAGVPVTFWIGKSSRALLQQEMLLRPGVAVLFTQPKPPTSTGRAG